jgi:hypothetical protein
MVMTPSTTEALATVREALRNRKYFSSSMWTRQQMDGALAALSTLKSEIERLEAMALDLGKVPEPYVFHQIEAWLEKDVRYYCQLMHPNKRFGPYITGTGPTPAAAFDAAVERTK